MKQAELIKKGEEITKRLATKYTSIILSRSVTINEKNQFNPDF